MGRGDESGKSLWRRLLGPLWRGVVAPVWRRIAVWFKHVAARLTRRPSLGPRPAAFAHAAIGGELTIEIPVAVSTTAFHGTCRVGAFTYINGGSEVSDADIGRYCSIAREVIIGPGAHPIDFLTTHPLASDPSGLSANMAGDKTYAAFALTALSKSHADPGRTIIGDDVWIGARAIVLRGVTVGTGAIIGAGAVVTKDVAPYQIVAGVPARVLRGRFAPEMIARLLASRWWMRDLSAMTVRDFSDPAMFLNVFDKIATKAFDPPTLTWPPTSPRGAATAVTLPARNEP
jgi:acetyltransferase-like isoleucine patch superfamily enzyme